MDSTLTRDTIVMGASAGGVEALPRVISAFPKGMPACVLVVQHMSDYSEPQLAQIIQRRAKIEVRWAEQGDRLEHGRVLVCPTGVHMLVVDSHIQLAATARENHVRPSIDRLFRSAAALRGSQTIGVLLTGLLDDGVAGLRAIQQAGGFTIVQDPGEAEFPDLPSRAIATFQPDSIRGLDALGPQIVELVGGRTSLTRPPDKVVVEAALDREDPADPDRMPQLGVQTSVKCPECGGPTWQVGDRTEGRYRCYLGHAYTTNELIHATHRQVETSLWTAIRALHERAQTYESLAEDAVQAGDDRLRLLYLSKATIARVHVETARKFMVELMTREAGSAS